MGKFCDPLTLHATEEYVFQWIITDFIRLNNVKYVRLGTNYLYEIHQTSQEIQTSLRHQICRNALFTSIQSDPDQNQEWLGWVGTKWLDKFGITNFS